jgi:hypothetical protein
MFRVTWGLGSIIATAAAAAALLLTIISDLADLTAPLGVPESVWVSVAAVLAGTVVIGRMHQRARGVQRPVEWGPGSAIGYLGSLALVLVPLVGDLADALHPLGVPGSVWIVASAGLLVLTTLGRMDQGSSLDPGEVIELGAGPGAGDPEEEAAALAEHEAQLGGTE